MSAVYVTFGAAWSVLVLYARERLGLGAVGFGLISTAMAVGGLLGTVSYGWLERHIRLGVIMRGGLIIETLTHLALALTGWAWFALIWRSLLQIAHADEQTRAPSIHP